jgi:hypothetical protein
VLHDYPTPYLKCRAIGHMWDEWQPADMRTPEFGIRYSLLCITCGTERHDLIDANGHPAQREYRYPDDYKMDFKITRAEAKLELFERKDRYIRTRRTRRFRR